MPPLPPVTDVIKVNLGWICGSNQKAESIFHFKYSGGPPSSSDCTALATAFQSAALTQFIPLLNPNYGVGVCTVLDINSSTGAAGSAGTITAGTRTGTPLAANTCVVVNHTIARRYRGGKPRTYTPMLDESDLATVGTWNPVKLALVTTAFNAWITSCLAASSGSTTITQYGSVSYYLNGALRATPEWDPITASAGRDRMGTQRRRMKTA